MTSESPKPKAGLEETVAASSAICYLDGDRGVLAFAAVNYATLNIGRRLAAMTGAAGFVEWLVIGVIIGLVYKPAPGSRR